MLLKLKTVSTPSGSFFSTFLKSSLVSDSRTNLLVLTKKACVHRRLPPRLISSVVDFCLSFSCQIELQSQSFKLPVFFLSSLVSSLFDGLLDFQCVVLIIQRFSFV